MNWISVNDKLPMLNEKVLGFDYQRIYICYRKDEKYNEHWTICEDQDCSCIGCTGAIVYWMPLPKPPTTSS